MPKSAFRALPPEFNSWHLQDDPKKAGQFLIYHMCGNYRERDFHLPLCGSSEAARCGIPEVQTFQRLLVRANPCSKASRSESHCVAESGCRWCDAGVRCIPKASDCMLNTREARVLSQARRKRQEAEEAEQEDQEAREEADEPAAEGHHRRDVRADVRRRYDVRR